MGNFGSNATGRCIHVMTFDCKSEELAKRCMADLDKLARPEAMQCNCKSFEYGLKEGPVKDCVYLCERWEKWEDLDKMINEKAKPNLVPIFNEFLKRPIDFQRDSIRVTMQGKY